MVNACKIDDPALALLAVRGLVAECPEVIHSIFFLDSESGTAPLLVMVCGFHLEIVRYLLEEGAVAELPGAGLQPLHTVAGGMPHVGACHNRLELAKLLKEAGASLRTPTCDRMDGKLPIHIACSPCEHSMPVDLELVACMLQ